MTTSPTPLFMAILSMDAYNRGYGAGLVVPSNLLGGAIVGENSSILGASVDQNAGFFAVSHSWNGQTIISYRGTDVLPNSTNFVFPSSWADVAAWSIWATQNYDTRQAELAAQFYNAVAASPSAQGKSIVLTGHSLGGALAGFCNHITQGQEYRRRAFNHREIFCRQDSAKQNRGPHAEPSYLFQ